MRQRRGIKTIATYQYFGFLIRSGARSGQKAREFVEKGASFTSRRSTRGRHLLTIGTDAEGLLIISGMAISNLFVIGAGFTKAVFPSAPLNDDLLSQVGPQPDDSPLGQVWSEYELSNIETLLTRFDLDLLTGKSRFGEDHRNAVNKQLLTFASRANSTLCERFPRSRVYPAKSGSGGALLRRHLTDLALTELSKQRAK